MPPPPTVTDALKNSEINNATLVFVANIHRIITVIDDCFDNTLICSLQRN